MIKDWVGRSPREADYDAPCAAELAWRRVERQNERRQRRFGEPIDDFAAKHGALSRRAQSFADDDENERTPARMFATEKALERLPGARRIVSVEVARGGRSAAQCSTLPMGQLAARPFDEAVRRRERERWRR